MKYFTEVAFVKRMQIIHITQDILEKGVYILERTFLPVHQNCSCIKCEFNSNMFVVTNNRHGFEVLLPTILN